MIPLSTYDGVPDFVIVPEPSRTYGLNFEKHSVSGAIDGLEAVKQAIYKVLNTERYQHVIYSWNYGVELQDLFGMPKSYVYPELERRITEALIQDDRITSVEDFTFEGKKNSVLVRFTVHTVNGDIESETVVVV